MPSGARPKVYPAEIVAKIQAMYESNMTQTEIASELGLTQRIVWSIMRRHGIQTRTAAKRNQTGEKNASWKGNEAGRCAFHRRLYALYGKPSKCGKCGTESANNFDYANLTGRYEDINDYMPMCRSCHAIYDHKHRNFGGGKEGYREAH